MSVIWGVCLSALLTNLNQPDPVLTELSMSIPGSPHNDIANVWSFTC